MNQRSTAFDICVGKSFETGRQSGEEEGYVELWKSFDVVPQSEPAADEARSD